MDRPDPPSPSRAAGAFARWVVRLRWFVVVFWIAAAVAATVGLPSITDAGTGAVGSLVPDDADAIEAEERAARDFGVPLLTRTVAVIHEEGRLREPTLKRLAGAASASAERVELTVPERLAARAPPIELPPEVAAVAPLTDERDTAIAYVFTKPDVGEDRAETVTETVGERLVGGTRAEFVGATGAVPARIAGQQTILDHIFLVEIATIALVLILVGLHFRALAAPLLNLLTVGIAYLLVVHGLGWLGTTAGIDVPRELEPVIIVLLFGVVTDYFVFFTSRFGGCLQATGGARRAAVAATSQVVGVVMIAGLTVAAATSSLLVADLQFFRVFGPGLAVCVLIGLAVAVTFLPAVLAIAGRGVFWPRMAAADRAAQRTERAAEIAGRERGWWRHPRAFVVGLAGRLPIVFVVLVGAALLAAGLGLQHVRFDNPLIRELPSDALPAAAYDRAAAGFGTGGVIAPTQLVVRGGGAEGRPEAVAELERRLRDFPGVTRVIGPSGLGGEAAGVFRSRRADAVRLLVVLDGDPLGADAIRTVRRLQDRLPDVLEAAGLTGARGELSGDSALSAEIVDRTRNDLLRVAPVAILVITLVLALYLRAPLIALVLVLASVLTVPAALGVVGWVLADLVGSGAVAYFVPFATAILLVALGCDYNVFLVGRIRDEARRRPLRQAVGVAGTQASRPITVAGIILAASFALLALVPLESFRMIAAIMAAGLLLDILLVRTLLVPAIVALMGGRTGWDDVEVSPRAAP